jgi:hypothetical protein
MDREGRKTAIATFKKRKPAWGVYAVTCTAAGEAWVGCSRGLDAQRNRLWFELGLRKCPNASLQAAWNQCGADGFRFEELERLRKDFPEFARDGELKKRQVLWRSRLQALAV